MITFEEFLNSDIRIGTVIEAVVPEWSHWVIRMKIDLGPEIGTKTAFSGIMKFYKPEDLAGKQYPFVVNLVPKKVGPERELSEVMMIMAAPKDDEETKPILFQLQEPVANGVKVR